MGGSSGGGGSTTTVQKADPWKGVQPYLKDFYANADEYAYGSSPEWYPGTPLVDYRNPFYQQGTSDLQNALSGMYGAQVGLINPFQGVTNSFYSDMTNPIWSGQSSDLSGGYNDPWSSVSDQVPSYLGTSDQLVNRYNPNISGNESFSGWGNVTAGDWQSNLNNIGSNISYENANPYLDQQIGYMRDKSQEDLDKRLLAWESDAIGSGNLGSSRKLIGDAVRTAKSLEGRDIAESSMRSQAWDNMLREQTARAQIASQNQANTLGYLGSLAGTQAGFLQGQDATRANYDTALQGLSNQWAMNALNQGLGFGSTMGGTQAGYQSAMSDAMLDYQGDRQGNYLDYLSDAARTQMGMYGMAPTIYGMNQQNYLAPYSTMGQMGELNYSLGSDLNAYDQAIRNNEIAQFEYNRDYERNRLNDMALWLGGAGSLGGTTTSTAQNPASNPMLGALGGGMAGYQLGSMLPSMLSIGTAGGAPIYGSSLAAGAAGMGAWPLAIAGALMGGLLN